MNKITQTTPSERLKHARVLASASASFVAITQMISRERIEQIFLSSGVDFGQTLVSSFTNGSIYNFLKQRLHNTTDLSERTIIQYSIILVSVLGVGTPKYIIHKMAGTSDPEFLSLLYTIGNMIVLWLYEKHILQPRKEG